MRRSLLTLIFAAGLCVPAAYAWQSEGKIVEKEVENEDAKLLGWKWANFGLLVLGLGYLTVKMGGPFFRSRGETIRRDLETAEQRKAEAEARTAEVNARIANLSREITSLKDGLQAEQQRQVERLQRESEAELARIRTQSEMQIEAATKTARLELRRYAARLAVEVAEQKIRERMTPEMEDRLSGEFLEKLKA